MFAEADRVFRQVVVFVKLLLAIQSVRSYWQAINAVYTAYSFMYLQQFKHNEMEKVRGKL
jgi:hypothetical protein